MIGTTIAQYTITEHLGGGGMGIVYKAEDTILGRPVALKFLPPELLRDPEATKRFMQEARAASALDHDNICTIYDFGETDNGQLFIVMAFYDGDTLKHRLSQGPLTADQAVDIAMKVASGLQKAHQHGIIHRDITPANIMLTTGGRVKIFDFGLAKLVGQPGLTRINSTVGTPAYMSPEQTRGDAVDHRTDLWSLGVVLYEMLRGEVPFKGEYEQAIVYSILNETPAPPHHSPEMDRIVAQMLAKHPSERYQTCTEVLDDLRRVHSDAAPAVSDAQKKQSRMFSWPAVMVLAMTVALVFAVMAIFQPFSRQPPPPLNPVPFTSLPGSELTPAFSPHGDQIAFAWNGEHRDNYDIYVKITGTVEQQRLTTDPSIDVNPAWSPDGRLIAFTRIHGDTIDIYTIPARGGSEQKLPVSINLPKGFHQNVFILRNSLAWSADNKSLIYRSCDVSTETWRLMRLNLETLRVDTLTFPDVQWFGDTDPALSPDGTQLAFMRTGHNWRNSDIWVQPYPDGTPVQITFVHDAMWPSWANRGQDIVFNRFSSWATGGALWRIPAQGGKAELILHNAKQAAISGPAKRLAYVESRDNINIWRIALADVPMSTDQSERFIASTRPDRSAAYSHDGRRIVYVSHRSGAPQIWVCDQDGRNHRQLTSFGSGVPGSPRWAPDDRRIAFDYASGDTKEIYTIAIDGGVPKRLTTRQTDDAIPRWSRDNRWIYFRSNLAGDIQIWKVSVEGGELTQVTANGGFAVFESSDGEWLYFSKPAEFGLWKMPVDGGAEELVTDYPVHPRNWVLEENGVYFIRNSSEPGFYIEFLDLQTSEVTRIAVRDEHNGIYLDVSPDGKWLLFAQLDQAESDINLVEDFK